MKRYLPLAILSLIFYTHCTKNTLQPQLNPEVINQPDQFEFKIADIRFITQQLEYQWQNNGINANIHNFSNIREGNATLTVIDRIGAVVHTIDLRQSGDFFSSSGSAGEWTVRLNMINVSGTIHFRVNRRL